VAADGAAAVRVGVWDVVSAVRAQL
jgi:hypothetical protein